VAVQVAELKHTPLAAEEPLGLLVDQAVLEHNHHSVRARVVEAEPLQLLRLLEVVVQGALVGAVVAEVRPL
jgi:hypothetical protein